MKTIAEINAIRDKMQAKFRQINKFIEHIEAIKDKLPKENINIYDIRKYGVDNTVEFIKRYMANPNLKPSPSAFTVVPS